jgi:hypothetical protein
MVRYWIQFEIAPDELETFPEYLLVGRGCGVTASDMKDAKHLLRDRLFRQSPIPTIKVVIENVDVSTLDEFHILPNIGVPVVRGVWYPKIG